MIMYGELIKKLQVSVTDLTDLMSSEEAQLASNGDRDHLHWIIEKIAHILEEICEFLEWLCSILPDKFRKLCDLIEKFCCLIDSFAKALRAAASLIESCEDCKCREICSRLFCLFFIIIGLIVAILIKIHGALLALDRFNDCDAFECLLCDIKRELCDLEKFIKEFTRLVCDLMNCSFEQC